MERGKGKLALGTDMATASGDAAEGGRLRLQMGRVRPQPQAWGKEGSEWGRHSLSCALEGTLSPAAVGLETGQGHQSSKEAGAMVQGEGTS